MLEALPVLIFFMKDGKIIYVNRFVETLLGYPREEVIGKSLIKDLICEPDRPKAEAHCKKVMKGVREEGVIFALQDKYGRICNFIWNCFLTQDWEGDPIVISIASDISELLELSQKIEKIHKTQTFSEFLRGLVHDFNNVLHTIQSYLKELRSARLVRWKAFFPLLKIQFFLGLI